MALKNKTIYAILGILNLSPGTGYDIKKYSDTVLSGFWHENYGHIYPTLKKMLNDGLIAIASGNNHEKKILYYITAKGKQTLEAWLAADTVAQPIRSELMLKLLFSSSQPKESTIRMLEKYKALHEKDLARYLDLQKDLGQGIQEIAPERTYLLNAVLRRGIISDEAVIRWCDETIAALRHASSH